MSRPTFPPQLSRTALAATLLLIGGAVQAQVSSMSATGRYSMDGGASTDLLSTFPPLASVDVLDFQNQGSSGVGLHSYGSISGDFGSRSSGMGVYQVSGGFKLVQTVTNASAVAQSAKFTFSITPGMVNNTIGTALGADQYVEAGLNFEVKKGTGTIWDSSAKVRSDALGSSASFTGDTSLYAGSGAMYQVLGVTREIDLGVINAGESFELSYELTTFANGVSAEGPDRWVEPTTFTVPEGWYVYGSCNGYGYGGYGYGCGYQPPGTVIDVPGYWVHGSVSGSHASSGDPFQISFGPDNKYYASVSPNAGYGVVSLQPVPEPASYALLLGGLGVLGWVARRRRRSA